eukprot:CAMPEP_0172528150 /NCGR_PEP_ID=MMETSP1067-20121228/2633_1 /TAXON_ID=265564 ORGANISM="Thalassiosira punctigera, Strain Tpunct2005C2" /NCGR_SAMPLE_ID=MMETSP1067 /ASSEMBLY_ACC=CAM_ASM_000444 /LENGTH=454 /DNA_ID=CAMNT_0013312017 /DNA_START=30 /DNA_END=1394 /DNA_ORIENTATION=+
MDLPGPGGFNTNNDDEVVKDLVKSNEQMKKDMEYLKNRLNSLEMMQQQPVAPPNAIPNDAGDSVVAVNGSGTAKRGKSLRDSMGLSFKHPGEVDADNGVDANNDPPMRKIKFLDLSPQAEPTDNAEDGDDKDKDDNADGGDDDDDSSSSSTWSDEDPIAFSGWARVFFQARHHRSATQVTSGAACGTTSQDTYLHLSIYSTANKLRISNEEEDQWKPPLISIPLKYFYAAKVPGSRSGAALFLKNDSRRLRKYIFRFEFVNRAVHQPPARYVQFLRSGKAAKRSMRMANKMKSAFGKMGEERRENAKENKKRAQDAFAAHLGALDELLKESDDAAESFVQCVNIRNDELEEIAARGASARGGSNLLVGSAMMGDGGSGRRRRSKPPPPYWGSGFNRPSTNEADEMDDGDDSESDYSEEEDELYYDDDHDDETFFDKVQVSTEQTLESLFNHIVK